MTVMYKFRPARGDQEGLLYEDHLQPTVLFNISISAGIGLNSLIFDSVHVTGSHHNLFVKRHIVADVLETDLT